MVFISATCMPMSYSVNHLGQHNKSLLVGFFTPCWFPYLRHLCMQMGSFMFVVFMSATCMPKSYWANHLGQQSKPLPVGFFTPCSFPPLGILSWWFSSLLHVCQCRTPWTTWVNTINHSLLVFSHLAGFHILDIYACRCRAHRTT